jgi:hypothetical protein
MADPAPKAKVTDAQSTKAELAFYASSSSFSFSCIILFRRTRFESILCILSLHHNSGDTGSDRLN